MRFLDKLVSRLEATKSPLCVGLDSRYDRFPKFVCEARSVPESIEFFNREIIDRVHPLAGAVKCNLAFYAGFGAEGLEGLRRTTRYIKDTYPSIPLLADCKRSEMGDSVSLVRREIIEDLGFDCVMVTPWFGFDTVRDYLSDDRCGVVVYAHDSNPSAPEFQGLTVSPPKAECPTWATNGQLPLYEYVAWRVSNVWNTNGNVILEAGLTYPHALRRIREIAGDEMPLLVAGLGAQGGKAADLAGLFGTNRSRLLVNVSRGISFPSLDSEASTPAAYFDQCKKAAIQYVEELCRIRDAGT